MWKKGARKTRGDADEEKEEDEDERSGPSGSGIIRSHSDNYSGGHGIATSFPGTASPPPASAPENA